jgi:hypothetical protein
VALDVHHQRAGLRGRPAPSPSACCLPTPAGNRTPA